jgi:hypothetical protein
MRFFLASFAAARREHPWMVPGVALTGSAALGSALPGILDVFHRVLS